MYSIVLVTALVSTSEAPSWHVRGCSSACHGCHGGYAWRIGCGGHGRHACHSCTVSCASGQAASYGCAGGCQAYQGGCYGAGYVAVYVDPRYSGCTGCYGCHGGYSGYGTPVPLYVDPRAQGQGVPPPPPTPQPETKEEKKGAEEVAPPKEVKPKVDKQPTEEQTRAKVRIEIPQGGKLFVDGKQIKTQAGTRVFRTPPLEMGERYFYDFRIEVMLLGRVLADEQRVIIERGQEVAVEFENLRRAIYAANQRP